MIKVAIAALTGLLGWPSAMAGEADVLNARVDCSVDRICIFHVTVQHADDGWRHYANRWEILDSEGKQIAVRELAHPHDHEQPFTRSLDNVDLPTGLVEVRIRAHDSQHGHGGEEIVVSIPRQP